MHPHSASFFPGRVWSEGQQSHLKAYVKVHTFSKASHLINLYLEMKALPQSGCKHLKGRSLEWE